MQARMRARDPERSLRLRRSTASSPLDHRLLAAWYRSNRWPSRREEYVPAGIGRREFIAALGSMAAWPPPTRAQPTERVRRAGVVLPREEDDDAEYQARLVAFVQALHDLGW